jgi:hypothetical protein
METDEIRLLGLKIERERLTVISDRATIENSNELVLELKVNGKFSRIEASRKMTWRGTFYTAKLISFNPRQECALKNADKLWLELEAQFHKRNKLEDCPSLKQEFLKELHE